MRYATPLLLLVGLALVVVLRPAPEHLAGREPDQKLPADTPPPRHRHPDFGFMPPAHQYEGRVFKLSQDFPTTLPDASKVPAVCTTDFAEVKKNWKQYLLDVRAYCFKDTIFGGDVEDDWRVENSPNNHWYHMPWQHYGPNGREGVHGLTREAPVQPRQLAWTQTHVGGQTQALGFYNEFGGYTIGQVWKDHDHPAKGMKKIEFPVGTVVCKVLFVDVPLAQVPSLNPPLRWQAYIGDNYDSEQRSIRDVALIQMDVMIRLKDAPTGWIFGTYQYNAKRKGGEKEKNLWNHLVPVGLQWGNDPDVRDHVANPQPTKTVINTKLKETVINDDPDELPATHLGWNGRLNGPVDNTTSSCMSCHMTSSTPQRSQMSPMFEKNPPSPGSDEWMRWFRNVKCAEPFDKDTVSTDFSLQMSIALQNFRSWRNEGTKMHAEKYKSTKVPARVKGEELTGPNIKEMRDDETEGEVDILRALPVRRNP